jgi:WD40 repeat protein
MCSPQLARYSLLFSVMKFRVAILSIGFVSGSALSQDAEKITYADHVRPLLENKCFSCHNPDKKKGDLDLTSFAALMVGGGGGTIVEPGNSDSSRIWTTCAKKEEPFMPPEGSPFGPKELDIIAKWIAGGVLDTKSSLAKKSSKPKIDMGVVVTSGRPEGPIAKPENVLLEPVIVTPRTTAVVAMAASPWTSLLAVAGQKQILLYDTDTKQLAGVFPYSEGYARSLKFSQNGSLLVMGGGRGGKLGHAVVWDVKSGRRITEVGKEFDQVMSADISADHKMVAIGSPSKKVKCYDSATGEELYVISKHTEWIMGVDFSPDGVLLATSDRNGNVMVWEADNGGEFYVLGQHKASCTDLSWRADSNILASCSLDGTISTWEMSEGKQVKNWAAHSGGVQSISFTPDGKIVSSGNDGIVRTWDVNGTKLNESTSQGDLVTKVAALHDSKVAVSANWQGEIKFLSLENKLAEVGTVSSNPPMIAQRIAQTEQRISELNGKAAPSQDAVKKAELALAGLEASLTKTRADAAALDARTKSLPGEIAATEKSIGEFKANREKSVKEKEARALAIKQYGERVAAIGAIEKELAPVAADPAKSAPIAAKLAKAKAELGAAPAPLAEIDKVIADLDGKLKAATEALAAKKAETPKVAEALKTAPQRVKDSEAAVGKGKEAIAAAQGAARAVTDELALMQRMIPALKAAQFNVGVLAEKATLAKLETDVSDFTAALKENEEGKVAAAARIESSKKSVADAIAALPAKEDVLKKLKDALVPVEKAHAALVAANAEAAAKLEAHKKVIAGKEAELGTFGKLKDDAITAAKKAAEELSKQLGVLTTQHAEVSKKAAEPSKVVEQKKAELVKAQGVSDEAKKPLAAAQKKLDETLAALKGPAVKAQAELDAAAKDLAQTRTVAIGKPEMQEKVAIAQKAVDAKATALATAQKAFEAGKVTIQQAEAAVSGILKAVADKDKLVATAKLALDAAEKVLTPSRDQIQKLQASIDSQKKALAEKQAAPAAIEKDTAAKVQATTAAIAALKAEQPALEKLLAEAKAKVDAGVQGVEGKRAEVAKAAGDVDAVKKQKTDGELAIAAATKEIPTRDKAVAECKTELAKLQPQLEPLRAKVKQLSDQYLALLPK